MVWLQEPKAEPFSEILQRPMKKYYKGCDSKLLSLGRRGE
jgi:hypothetical protein